jgi:hypothetical protein
VFGGELAQAFGVLAFELFVVVRWQVGQSFLVGAFGGRRSLRIGVGAGGAQPCVGILRWGSRHRAGGGGLVVVPGFGFSGRRLGLVVAGGVWRGAGGDGGDGGEQEDEQQGGTHRGSVPAGVCCCGVFREGSPERRRATDH